MIQGPNQSLLGLRLPEQETRPDRRAFPNDRPPTHSPAIISRDKHCQRSHRRRSDNSLGNMPDVGLLTRSHSLHEPGSQNIPEALLYSVQDTESNTREIRQRGSSGVFNTNG
ncbi:uncharacterized protein ACNLHF_026682 isoform 1-T1 [Anomaloglossus baeobatrachus]